MLRSIRSSIRRALFNTNIEEDAIIEQPILLCDTLEASIVDTSVELLPTLPTTISETSVVNQQFQHVSPYQDSDMIDFRSRYPKRVHNAPTDVYQIKEIAELINANYLSDEFQDLISIKGPLPLGNQLTEEHLDFLDNPFLESLAGKTHHITDPDTGDIILWKRKSGWCTQGTFIQVYDNKGNRATDDVDFEICQVRKTAIKGKFQVHFTDWTHLQPMDMSWDQLTRNGSNKFMSKFLSYLTQFVAVNKWQSLGGKKAKRRKLATESKIQTSVRNLSITQAQMDIQHLSQFIAQDNVLMINSDETGCLMSCVINALQIDASQWEPLQDALLSVMSFEMLAHACDKNSICRIQKLKYKCAIEYLAIKIAELSQTEWLNELELYIIYDPKSKCHGVSIDLHLKLIYDSASDYKKPYHYSEEVLALLGFTRSNCDFELRKLAQIQKKYKAGKVHHKRKMLEAKII